MKKYLRPAIFFRIVIAIAYVVLGVLLFLLNFSVEILQPKTKVPFAMLIILYGIFRMYRVFKMANAKEDI